MPGPGENPLGHSNGFDDDWDASVRRNGGDYSGLENGPGGLFPVGGGPWPSNANFSGAFDRFQGHQWMEGIPSSSGKGGPE